MKDYIVFGWDIYKPNGGTKDIVASFEEVKDAIDYSKNLMRDDQFLKRGRKGQFSHCSIALRTMRPTVAKWMPKCSAISR